MKIKISVLFLPVLLLFFTPPTFAIDYSIKQITNTSYDNHFNVYPVVNASGDIVWLGSVPSQGTEVFYYSGVSGITQQLTSDPYDKYSPTLNSRGDVVWDDSNENIFLYKADSKQTIPLGAGLRPFLNDNGDVTWGTPDVYLYKNSSGSTTKISDNLTNNFQPRINSSGDVVWAGSKNGSQNIFLYNGQNIIQISNNSQSYNSYPQINNEGDIAWAGAFNGGVYLYDNINKKILEFGNDVNSDSFNLNQKGQLVWEDVTKIYFYDGNITKLIYQCYLNYSAHPKLNDNGDIVWSDWDGSSDEIFLYDISSGITSMLTDNNYDNTLPQIADNGEVVWEGGTNGHNRQIFEATPTTAVPEPSTMLLVLSGLLGLPFMRRKR